MPTRDPHDILGVERGAGMPAIKAAWRKLARAHHPDISGDDAEATRTANARMAEINAAYDLLRRADLERRSGLRDAVRQAGERGRDGAPPGSAEEPVPRSAGPPRPRPTRPVTGRVDMSDTFRPRNSTTGARARAGGRGAGGGPSRGGPAFETSPLGGAGTPPRARPIDREPPRASDPTGPLRRRRSVGWTPPPEPSFDEATAVVLAFGKFHGHTLGEVADFEPSYIDWLASTISHDPDLVMAARVMRRRLDERGVRRRVRPDTRHQTAAD